MNRAGHSGLAPAGKHIDIRLPPGRAGDDDDDNDEDEDDNNNDDPAGANVNFGGAAVHQLQLPPLPKNATVQQLTNVSFSKLYADRTFS